MFIKRLISVAVALCITIPAFAGFGLFQVFQTSVVTCNIVTGVASANGPCASPVAVCDGSTNDNDAFMSFNTWAIARGTTQVILFIPSGKNCYLNDGSGDAIHFVKGIKNVVVSGSGATLSGLYHLGGEGICHKGLTDAAGCSARIQTVSSGATSVQLTSASLAAGYASRFIVGRYAIVTGFDLQGTPTNPAFPPNLHYFDYVLITAVNALTGVIQFTPSLSNSYKSTWPNYYAGTSLEADAGGPATIYALDSSWDIRVQYIGLTFDTSLFTSHVNNLGRYVSFDGVSFGSNAFCSIPSQNYSYNVSNSSMSNCAGEFDKLVHTATYNNVTFNNMDIQSSSNDNLVVINSTFDRINGTPKNATITGSTINTFKPGPFAYGRGDSITITSSTIGTWEGDGGYIDKGWDEGGFNNDYIISAGTGIITVANSIGAMRWAVPGTNLFWSAQVTGPYAVQVTDVTQDASNTYISTTYTGATWPAVPLATGKLYVQVHPAPRFTCTGCAGDPVAVDLNNAPAGAPLYSYSQRQYTTSGSKPSFTLWGTVTSATFDVTQAFGGGGALTMTTSSSVLLPDYSASSYSAVVNLKQTGTRLVTPSGVTCNGSAGACSGDSGLTLPNAVSWLSNIIAASYSTSWSGSMTLTTTIQTDQGVVYP